MSKAPRGVLSIRYQPLVIHESFGTAGGVDRADVLALARRKRQADAVAVLHVALTVGDAVEPRRPPPQATRP